MIRTLFHIISFISSEATLVRYALTLINGIIEDNRSRIKYLYQLQKSYNESKKVDCMGILFSYLL